MEKQVGNFFILLVGRVRGLYFCSSCLYVNVRVALFFLLSVFVFLSDVAYCEDVRIFYPQLRQPYSDIFSEIIAGINSEIDGRSAAVELTDTDTIDVFQQKILLDSSQPVILLGQSSVRLAQKLSGDRRFVSGASYLIPKGENFTSVLYYPSPYKIFNHARKLLPNIDQVYVVINVENNQWLSRQAAMDAKALGIDLILLDEDNLYDSAKAFRKIFSQIDVRHSALWVVQDPTILDDGVIVPFILEQAWKSNVVLIANNLAYVNRGMLFSLYPDNFALGRSLAQIANRVANGKYMGQNVRATENLKSAINIKTAQHLGLELNARELGEYNLIFPQR